MCGRFELTKESLQEASKIAQIPQIVQKSLRFGEIFPTNQALVLKEQDKSLVGASMKFGYRYTPKQDPSIEEIKPLQSQNLIINARAESADSKWMFRKAFKNDRIVVVCSSFYEWDSHKQKISFFEKNPTMYLAALALDDSFVILTKEANSSIEPFHHRMPVIFNAKQAQEWILDSSLSQTLLKQASPLLSHAIVTSKV